MKGLQTNKRSLHLRAKWDPELLDFDIQQSSSSRGGKLSPDKLQTSFWNFGKTFINGQISLDVAQDEQ